ncbi:hypothetical protein ACFLZV_03125, partial [Candidatus Margulisiibacteriota bacterium]
IVLYYLCNPNNNYNVHPLHIACMAYNTLRMKLPENDELYQKPFYGGAAQVIKYYDDAIIYEMLKRKADHNIYVITESGPRIEYHFPASYFLGNEGEYFQINSKTKETRKMNCENMAREASTGQFLFTELGSFQENKLGKKYRFDRNRIKIDSHINITDLKHLLTQGI